jgi:hypothetical protein
VALQEGDSQNTFGSDVVNSAERVGLYLSNLLEGMNVTSELVVETENLCEYGLLSTLCMISWFSYGH